MLQLNFLIRPNQPVKGPNQSFSEFIESILNEQKGPSRVTDPVNVKIYFLQRSDKASLWSLSEVLRIHKH